MCTQVRGNASGVLCNLKSGKLTYSRCVFCVNTGQICQVIIGHFPYTPVFGARYFNVVRHPVRRWLSLYSYYTRNCRSAAPSRWCPVNERSKKLALLPNDTLSTCMEWASRKGLDAVLHCTSAADPTLIGYFVPNPSGLCKLPEAQV